MNIDKRSGRRFGPPTTKRLIFFLDDMNLPYVETYGTQNAIALLTQIVGYGTFFDRGDLGFRKEVRGGIYLHARGVFVNINFGEYVCTLYTTNLQAGSVAFTAGVVEVAM